jgi:hypothetical protein
VTASGNGANLIPIDELIGDAVQPTTNVSCGAAIVEMLSDGEVTQAQVLAMFGNRDPVIVSATQRPSSRVVVCTQPEASGVFAASTTATRRTASGAPTRPGAASSSFTEPRSHARV